MILHSLQADETIEYLQKKTEMIIILTGTSEPSPDPHIHRWEKKVGYGWGEYANYTRAGEVEEEGISYRKNQAPQERKKGDILQDHLLSIIIALTLQVSARPFPGKIMMAI